MKKYFLVMILFMIGLISPYTGAISPSTQSPKVLILMGPPGSGKTMMARRLPSILPPMTVDKALEATKISSVQSSLGDLVGVCAG